MWVTLMNLSITNGFEHDSGCIATSALTACIGRQSGRQELDATMPELYVVRRCDGFYRYWHDVTDPAPLRKAHAAYDLLTGGGAHSVAPEDVQYYDIFAVAPLPRWQGESAPLVRRLHRHDMPAIEAHLLRLDRDDRRLRFFREATDTQILAYLRGFDWDGSLLLGAVRDNRVVGLAEALFDGSGPSHQVEVAVSVDIESRGLGLGRCLVRRAVDYAEMRGAPHASFAFLRENKPIQRIVRSLGGRVDMEDLVGVIRMGDVAYARARSTAQDDPYDAPLPSPEGRVPVHTRDIACCGYRRADGLWDIEARMTDRKGYAVHNDYRTVDAGAPFHHMVLRVTVDDTLLIHTIEARVDAGPHRTCPSVAANFQRVAGLRIEAGFGGELRRRLGGVSGCTHLVELFGPLATTAIQTVQPLRRPAAADDAATPPAQINACHALSAHGEVVEKYWPRFYHPRC
jgi:hypothetical protein